MGAFSRTVKKAVYKAAAWEPNLRHLRSRKLRNKIIVLMYHELAEDHDEIEAWTVVRKSDFVKQMEYLQRNFSIVSFEDAFQQMQNLNINEKPAAVITFDDGYAGNKRVLLPVIKSMNIPVTIFVATRAVQEQTPYWYDRLLRFFQSENVININLRHASLGQYCINRVKGASNWTEIERLLSDLKTLQPSVREKVVNDTLIDLRSLNGTDKEMLAALTKEDLNALADCSLVTIGAHSHDHNILTQLDREDVRQSIETSKVLLESWVGRPVNHFSYPNGNYNDLVVNVVEEVGFTCGLTTVSRPWRKLDSFFAIPRMGIGRYDSMDRFKVMVSGVFA